MKYEWGVYQHPDYPKILKRIVKKIITGHTVYTYYFFKDTPHMIVHYPEYITPIVITPHQEDMLLSSDREIVYLIENILLNQNN